MWDGGNNDLPFYAPDLHIVLADPLRLRLLLPALLLLPGLDGTEVFFRPLCEALPTAVARRVVTYPEQGPNGYDDLYPRVVAAAETAVADGGPCDVLGWSFSGPLALRLAAERPDVVLEPLN